MKNKKIAVSILFTLLILSSCSSKKDENTIKENVDKVTISPTKWNTPIVSKQPALNYDKATEKLEIWSDVVITPGVPKDLPKGVTIFNDSKTYINSNVPNYTFFILDKKTDVKEVSKYYTDILSNLWYQNKAGTNNSNFNNIDFGIKNKNYISMDKRSPENIDKLMKSWKIKNISDIENEYTSSINIKINTETPENIVKWMWIEGIFVEIYY